MEVKEIISSGILELYAAGLTSDAESEQVQAWLVQYPQVKAELDVIETALETYAQQAAVTPPAHIREQLLSRIDAPKTATKVVNIRSRSSAVNRWKWMAAASVAILIGTFVTYSVFNKSKKAAEPELVVLPQPKPVEHSPKSIFAVHHDEEEQMEKDARFVKVILHKANGSAEDCLAKVFWNKQTGEVFIDPCHLPGAPAGKQYQLWAIVKGKPVDAGLIDVDAPSTRYTIQKMKQFANAESFAVTLEKKGGTISPASKQMPIIGTVA